MPVLGLLLETEHVGQGAVEFLLLLGELRLLVDEGLEQVALVLQVGLLGLGYFGL